MFSASWIRQKERKSGFCGTHLDNRSYLVKLMAFTNVNAIYQAGDMSVTVLSSPSDRRARNRREMHDAILAAARAQMREAGVAALNLNEVARRVNLTTPALYKYFSSKRAIYDALFQLGNRLYRAELEKLDLASADSAESALRGALEHQLRFAVDKPELYQLIIQRPVPGFVPSEEGLKEAAQTEEVGGRIFAKLIAGGIIAPKGPPERAFYLLLAMMGGLADAHLANDPHLPVGEGRFGSLVPEAVHMFAGAWAPTARTRTVRRPKRGTDK